MTEKKLVVVDGMALLFRCYYGIGKSAGLTLSDGTPIWAVYGFFRILFKILKDFQPTHFALAWDLKGPTFRHERYAAYKANRSAPPPDIIPQIHAVKKAIDDMKLCATSCAGYEGDDCAGTLSTWFREWGNVFILTADKDFMQLVEERVQLISLKTGDDYDCIGRDGVIDYFGVPPENVTDLLALIGDTSDNVPGVKGIGKKGGAKLIQEMKHLDHIYNNIEDISNAKIREALKLHKGDAYLSKELVTIERQVPLNLNLDDLAFNWNDFLIAGPAYDILKSLEMPSLIKSYGFQSTTPYDTQENGNSSNSSWGSRDYTLVDNLAQLEFVLNKIKDPTTQLIAFDTETTGLDHLSSQPIGLSFCFDAGTAYYIPIHEQHIAKTSLKQSPQEIQKKVTEALKLRHGILIGHNLKFDLHMISNVNMQWGEQSVACTMVASWMIDSSSGGFGLDALTKKWLGLEKIPTSDLIQKSKKKKGVNDENNLFSGNDLPSTMLDVPLEKLCEYACEDVDATLRLWHKFSEKMKILNLWHLFSNLEMPLLLLLVDMERTGVFINSDSLADLREEVEQKINETKTKIFELAGEQFNISSPKQLGQILFEKIKIQEGKKVKLQKTTLGFKTDAGVLEQFQDHPLVAEIMKHRELAKLQSTYITVLPQLVNEKTGRIHTHFHQIGTATGRLSSADPNLQNIPIRTELGRRIRETFCAQSNENIFTCVDYSQIELRVLAHLSEDPTMIAAFHSGADIHKETAARINNIAPEDVSYELRSRAKAINFGIIYGMGAQRLAKEQKISYADAKIFIEKYFLNFAKIREFIDKQITDAHKTGSVRTHFGRLRYIRGLDSSNQAEVKGAENIAVNTPIQGTAADIVKQGMLLLHKRLRSEGLQTRILIQVHDELVLEGPISEAEHIRAVVQQEMQAAAEFLVPLTVSVGQGSNWIDAK